MERPPNPYEKGPEKNRERVRTKCPRCGGSGKVKESGKEAACKPCNGTGQIWSS